jgi:hypothetical protein|tara:strand:+ start:211 stop:495 length:285 start_codon:yes stop_codon:yes gene_type:complete
MIVEYKFHRNRQGNKFKPYFIKDGGYFKDGEKFVGHTVDDGSYIPETLVVLDRTALITRLTNLAEKSDDRKIDNRAATAEEIEAVIDAFISKYG